MRPDDAYRPGKTKTSYTVNNRPQRRDIEARLSVPLEKAYSGWCERVRLEDGRSIEVEMPSGMMSGQKIRLKGQGFNGGDLYLKIDVSPHPFYQLQDGDIDCRVPVTPVEAILGRAIEVPTLDGPVKMNLPPGVQSGRRLRLAEKGYPRPDGSRGDQIVEIEVVIPPEVPAEARELYEKLYQLETFKPRQKLLQS
jgi:curved DNA-binding protein